MKAFKVHNAETVKQEVNLPAGTYTYSCRVIPVGTSYTFRLDNQSFTFDGLTAGILNKRMKHTFELTEAASFFYLSNTVGDCVYEPQIEEGVFATTPGAHPLDFERLISEAGMEIDHEALTMYAKKADVSAEIKIQADEIKSTVGNISNDVDGLKGDMTTISQTVNSITSTVTNHTSQISRFQQTVNQIYASIEDVGSGEFSHILQRIDQIEMKVGAEGQSGSIQVALDSIALTVYDENTGLSAINQKVDSITSTVTNHTTQISTFQQTVDQIYLAIEDVGSGEFASIITRLDEIELKVGATGKEGSIQVAVDSVTTRVDDIDIGLTEVVQTVNSISSTVYDEHGALLSQISQDGSDILIQGTQIDLRGATTINDNFKVLEDGSIVANNGEFKGGLRQPFVDVSESTVEGFWSTTKTSWACNFYEEKSTSSLIIRIIPCRSVLNGQIFRFHSRRRGIILKPEVAYKFYENGVSLDEIVLDAGEAIEMISVTINDVFKSWDVVRRYKCRKYNE